MILENLQKILISQLSTLNSQRSRKPLTSKRILNKRNHLPNKVKKSSKRYLKGKQTRSCLIRVNCQSIVNHMTQYLMSQFNLIMISSPLSHNGKNHLMPPSSHTRVLVAQTLSWQRKTSLMHDLIL
jgi:hypothetical protein